MKVDGPGDVDAVGSICDNGAEYKESLVAATGLDPPKGEKLFPGVEAGGPPPIPSVKDPSNEVSGTLCDDGAE